MSKRILIDFDGTLATYDKSKKYQDNIIYGVPTNGAREFLEWLQTKDFDIFVYSSRALSILGKNAIDLWLHKYDLNKYIKGITGYKLAAIAYIDDRSVEFIAQEGFNIKLKERILSLC